MIYSYAGQTVPAVLLTAVSAGQAAGVIFFADNIGSDAQLAPPIKQLVQAARRSPVAAPLLLMTDQEGGEVRRLPGARGGMNVNLAPVLDVYTATGDFIDQFQRSYGSSAPVVTECGESFITAQQHAGVAATAKHFPGLGTAGRSQNTDTGAVTLPVPLAQLRQRDEAPYAAAIAAGVKLIMVSWAVYPALDGARQAGQSSAVVQGELRGRLGYRGVTVTDALEAGALSAGPFGAAVQRVTALRTTTMKYLLLLNGQRSNWNRRLRHGCSS